MATGNLGQLLPALFVGKNGERLTEDQMRQRQAIASSLLKQATDTTPNAGGWASILAKGVQGFAAGRQNSQIDAALQANADATRAADNSFWSGLTGGTASTVPMPTAAGEVAATSPNPYTGAAPVTAEGEVADYIRQSATARGIDPDIALRVALSEGGVTNPVNQSSVIKNGVREPSYGPFQLYFGGGLGNKALAAGIDARDPNQWKQGVDFALDQARQGGWGPWYGAKKIGVTGMAGIGQLPQQTQVASAAPQTATDAIAAQSPVSAQGGYVDPLVTTAYAAPMPVESAPLAPVGQTETVSAPTIAPTQDISPVAQALVSQPTEAVKGGRVGAPFDQGRFASPEASPVFDINAAMQPQEAAPQQASPVAQTLASQAPQQAPFSIPQPQYRTAPPLNPGVIAALRNPDTSPETRRVAAALYQQNLAQQQAVQEENLKLQQGQQAIQQRVQVAQQLGINPANALDDETWKQAVQAASGGAKFINAGDGNIYNSQTGEWVQAPNSGKKSFRPATPEELKQYGAAAGQVGPDNKFYREDPPRGTSISYDPATGFSFNEGSGVTQKGLTEAQGKDSFFATRMTAALPTLDANESSLLSLSGKAADSVPLNLGNYAQSEDYQLAKDAGRDFVLAYLRKDSGAALTPAEERTYGELLLPQPGDKKERLAAKRQRRQVALEAIKSGMPPQAVDGVLKAIQAVPGADKAITPKKIGGYTVEEVTD